MWQATCGEQSGPAWCLWKAALQYISFEADTNSLMLSPRKFPRFILWGSISWASWQLSCLPFCLRRKEMMLKYGRKRSRRSWKIREDIPRIFWKDHQCPLLCWIIVTVLSSGTALARSLQALCLRKFLAIGFGTGFFWMKRDAWPINYWIIRRLYPENTVNPWYRGQKAGVLLSRPCFPILKGVCGQLLTRLRSLMKMAGWEVLYRPSRILVSAKKRTKPV